MRRHSSFPAGNPWEGLKPIRQGAHRRFGSRSASAAFANSESLEGGHSARPMILCPGGGREADMAGALGLDLRQRVIDAIEGGLSTRASARRFSIGISTAGSWYRQWRATGDLRPGRQGQAGRLEAGCPRGLHPRPGGGTEGHRAARDRRAAGRGAWGQGGALDGLAFLRQARHHIPYKKRRRTPPSSSDVLARRRAWFDGQPDLDPERLIFIDETGASTKMARLRRRAARGERCRAGVPHGHWKTTTLPLASGCRA